MSPAWVSDHDHGPDTPNIAAPAPEAAAAAEPVLAEVDMLIDRPDLAVGAATFVAAGDPIPPGLADRPRRAAARASSTRKGGGAKSRASTAARTAGTEGGAARP